MKVTITIEAGSATISEVLQNLADQFGEGGFEKAEKKTIEYALYDGGDANDGYGDNVGKIIAQSSQRPKKKKS
jgi:hypothetical protein